jgi:hypothetical protein
MLDVADAYEHSPLGVSVLEYLPALETFEIYTGKGFYNKRNWAYMEEEEMWTIICKLITPNPS